MTSITLYHYPGASSQFPYLLLTYARLKFEVKIPDPSSANFARINPKKQIPALVIDNFVVTENPAIAHAIHQLAPERQLFGRTPQDFVKVCEWMNWISAVIHAQTWSTYIRPWRFTTDQAGEAGIKESAVQRLLEKWKEIEEKLPGDGKWTVGEGFTAADAYLMQFYRFAKGGMGLDVAKDYPKWEALVQKVLTIEGFKGVVDGDQQEAAQRGKLQIR